MTPSAQPLELPLPSEDEAVREIRSADSGASSISRDEMNLAEFPLAVLSTRTDPSVKTLEFRDVQRLRTGEVIERQWVITGADKFGLPTSTDDDVVLGLIRLSIDHGFRDRKVFFTRYELLRVLRWSTEGRSYSRLTKSLDRLSGVRIKATNAFYDNTTKGYQTCNFGIIDAYELNDERNGRGGESKASYFIWSEALFESFKSGFIKKVDLELYFGLRSAISRRLYRYLDKHFYYRAVVERSLMPFSFEKLGLSRSYKFVSSIKQQLAPALKELVAAKFLDHVEYEGQGSETIVRFYRGSQGLTEHSTVDGRSKSSTVPASLERGSFNNSSSDSSVGNTMPKETSELYQSLLLRGLTSRQATKLLADRPRSELEKIRQIIRYFDYLMVRSDRRISKNPVGFLYRAVESPYRFVIPETFLKSTSRRNDPVAQSSIKFPDSVRPQTVTTDNNRELYERYFRKTLKSIRQRSAPLLLENLEQQIAQKMEPLRRALEPESFRQALDRLVDEELAKLNQIPSFREWTSAKGN